MSKYSIWRSRKESTYVQGDCPRCGDEDTELRRWGTDKAGRDVYLCHGCFHDEEVSKDYKNDEKIKNNIDNIFRTLKGTADRAND